MDEELQILALCMFITISRLEYALKASDFYCGNHRRVEPDWERFARTLEPVVDDEYRPNSVINSFKYILENPPKKQIIKGEKLDWIHAEPAAVNEVDKILKYVRRVRNNLFHGGKFFHGGFDDPERTK